MSLNLSCAYRFNRSGMGICRNKHRILQYEHLLKRPKKDNRLVFQKELFLRRSRRVMREIFAKMTLLRFEQKGTCYCKSRSPAKQSLTYKYVAAVNNDVEKAGIYLCCITVMEKTRSF